jgi:hypothetical protein
LPSDGPTTFISYSRADKEFVLRMARDLKSAGAKVWLDQLDIEPGQRWARALQDAITNSPRFLVVLSPHSVDSTNVEDEVAFALEEHKAIIPVLYCDCKVPFQLRPFQYVDFRTDYESGLRILLKTMGVDLPAGFMPSPVEPKAPVAEEQSVAAEKARQEELAKEAAERVRLAQEQKGAEEEARLEAERKAAAEQARLEKERKAAEKAAKEAEAKAAEQARLKQQHKAEEDARLEEERLQKAVPLAEVPAEIPQRRWGEKMVLASLAVVVGVFLYQYLLKGPQKKQVQDQGQVRNAAHVREIPPAALLGAKGDGERKGGLEGSAAITPAGSNAGANAKGDFEGTGAAKSAGAGRPIIPTRISSASARQALIGEHKLSLQWISWTQFGKATVTDDDGMLILKGEQRIGSEYVILNGTITDVSEKSFTFDGVIESKTSSVNNGQPCIRRGQMEFAITGNRRYWRMQKMDNPCEAVTDYVDIFMR